MYQSTGRALWVVPLQLWRSWQVSRCSFLWRTTSIWLLRASLHCWSLPPVEHVRVSTRPVLDQRRCRSSHAVCCHHHFPSPFHVEQEDAWKLAHLHLEDEQAAAGGWQEAQAASSRDSLQPPNLLPGCAGIVRRDDPVHRQLPHGPTTDPSGPGRSRNLHTAYRQLLGVLYRQAARPNRKRAGHLVCVHHSQRHRRHLRRNDQDRHLCQCAVAAGDQLSSECVQVQRLQVPRRFRDPPAHRQDADSCIEHYQHRSEEYHDHPNPVSHLRSGLEQLEC
mmetsp:Transcript_35027/g.79224  ORF Transcript_35027/g.79224 Transcript_35027/m.79224 type:complete len:277 (+) Transcript_35027:7797-8627(+)